jgi:hypothetical protein
MAIHKVEAPDGSIIKVEAPEGATQQQILEFAKSQYKPKPTPEQAQQQTYNPTAEAARAIGQGVTFGFGEEAEAGIRSALGQGQYKDIRNQLRLKQAQFQKENPYTSTGLEILGGLATPAGIYGLGSKALLKGGTTALSKIGKGAAIGAGAGAVTGAGVAPELQDVPRSSLYYGAGGAAIGGAAVPAIALTGRGLRGIAQGFGLGQKENIATRKLSETLEKENLTPNDVRTVLDEYRKVGVPEATIADLGANLQKLGYSSYIVPSKAKTTTEKFLQERTAGLPNELVEGLTQKSGVEAKQFGFDYITDLANKQQTQSRKLYPKAYSKDIPAEPFRKYADRDLFKQAYTEAQKSADALGQPLPSLDALNNADFVPTSLLHDIKIGLDRVYSKEVEPITGKVSGYGADIAKVKREFNDAIKQYNPEYKLANQKFADSAELQNAYKTGNDYLKMSESELISNLKDMRPAEKEAFRVGMLSKVKDNLSTFEGVDFTKKVFGSDRKRSALRTAFDSAKSYDEFIKQVEGQKQLIQTSRKVLGGSPTVENAMAAQDLQDIAPLASGNVTGFLSNLAGRGISRAGGIRPSVAEELQKRLFTTNPQEQYSILRDIEEARRRQGSLLRQPGTYGIIGGEIPGLLNNEMTTIDIPI